MHLSSEIKITQNYVSWININDNDNSKQLLPYIKQ
jgi:hypothetical protein